MRSQALGLHQFVARLITHSDISVEERSAILALPFHEMDLLPRTDLIVEDAPTSSILYVASGLVSSFTEARSAKRQIIGLHIPGDMINLDAANCSIGFRAFKAECATVVLAIPLPAVLELLERYPSLVSAFWRDGMADSKVLINWINVVGRKSARSKVAHRFCEMAFRYTKADTPVLAFDFPITQKRFADAVAMSPVHLNRLLRELREDRVLTFDDGKVVIHSWQRLARIGEFKEDYLVDLN